jgi:VWFA-related protein
VSALDKKGTPISALKATDFELTDDGHPVKDLNLQEHSSAQATPGPASPPTTPSVAVTFSNKPTELGAFNIVAVDLINTPKEERGHLQDQLNAFARQMPPGTRIALVTMASDIKILSSFPDGAPGFQLALKKGLGPLIAAPPANIIERGEVVESVDINHQDSLQHKASVDVERQSDRAQTTLDDFASIAKWLKPYPGKKNVFWISSGFPIMGKPFGTANYGSLASTYSGQKIPMQDKTDKELESARIAIYPIDVRGAAVASIDGETTADSTSECAKCLVTDTAKDSDLRTAQQSEMLEIAHATGGAVTIDNNLTGTLLKQVAQSATYYTLSYTPQADTWDGKYHRIKLAIHQPGTRLLYRQGYYARDTQSDPAPTMEVFRAALDPKTPPASAVLFQITILRNAATADIQYDIDPATIQFNPLPESKLQAELNLAILEFDAQGNTLDRSLVKLTETTDPGQQIKPSSINAKQTITLKPGTTTLVIGVRDRTTGKFGTIRATLPAHE